MCIYATYLNATATQSTTQGKTTASRQLRKHLDYPLRTAILAQFEFLPTKTSRSCPVLARKIAVVGGAFGASKLLTPDKYEYLQMVFPKN